MNHNQKYLLLLCILSHANLSATSIVYIYRITEITEQSILQEDENRKYMAVALFIDQYYKTYDDRRQNYAGGFAAFAYNFSPYYVRADFAVAHIHAKDQYATTFTGTETDDILFNAGRTFTFGEDKDLTITGLFSVPTHQIYSLQHPALGYGQFGAGIQLDASYPIGQHGALTGGVRYIRFFERSAQDSTGARYLFTIGNIQDALVAYKYDWLKNGIEVGYNPRVDFGAAIYPALDDTVERTNYTRSSLYAVYKYTSCIHDLRNRFLVTMAYSHDHRPKAYGNQYIISVWASWIINF